MTSRDFFVFMTTALLSIATVSPAIADDCYVNEAGHAIIIRDNDDGRANVIFDLGEDGFTAEGPRLGSIILTQYVGKDKERFANHKNGPETAVEFSKNLAKVKTSKSSPWNITGVKGDYHRLDLALMTEKLRGNEQFAAVEKQMETAMQALLEATPEGQRIDVLSAQKTWQAEIAEKMALDVLLDSNLLIDSSHKIIEAIPDAYIDVVTSRTKWLETLTKQQKDPSYMPTFRGIIYQMDRGGEGVNIMLRPDGQHTNLFLCLTETPACHQAEKLLLHEKTVPVQVTGKLDFTKGFVQGDHAIPVQAIRQPSNPTLPNKRNTAI